METYRITKKDLDKNNRYVGKLDLSDLDGNLEADESLGYVLVDRIVAKGYIYFKAGSGIKAGEGIKAGSGIEAGEGIKAGWGIEAGEGITCKLSLSFGYRLFAGLCIWKKEVTDAEKTITCGKLEKGTIVYGILKETGLPDEKKANVAKDKAQELEDEATKLLAKAKELRESL